MSDIFPTSLQREIFFLFKPSLRVGRNRYGCRGFGLVRTVSDGRSRPAASRASLSEVE
ncbi:hypothetical protein [Oscillatoria sp. FACHB-1406]|uniref:hypothetical protein n=1 Tax=Oscillatoria sp. FACHB-1406 TaxID=2692846 RepID=UPI001683CB1E|nr:hypothetical protein [Oscillatoria sp. FACHB-1406]MBD2577139.1 hypothetical protein [Oscillatoria sp. FACHB-1406]